MRLKGTAVALYTLMLGCLLLFAQSGTGTALGVALIALVSTAVVARVATDRPARGNRRRDVE
jgi:hypothetical protein